MRRVGWVYFIRPVGMDGPVKIGCSILPEARLKVFLQVAPWPLEIAAKVPGDESLESRFHQRFIDQHSHLEWFHPSADLTETVRQIAAGEFDADALPAPKRLPHREINRTRAIRERWARTA